MSCISKSSSRSSNCSSGFSSLHNDQYPPSFTIQTVLHIEQNDLNVREIFCGEQDSRLNELRQMTGAIIDLHVVPGTNRPFERVDWTVSHRNNDVSEFVLRRLNYWTQQTQLVLDMTVEDAIFLEKFPENSNRKRQAPPISAPKFSNRERTKSLTESEEIPFKILNTPIPATPMSCGYQRNVEIPKFSLHQTQTFKTHLISGRSSSTNENENENENIDLFSSLNLDDLIDSARWAGALSDTSDHEVSDGRVCFADTVSLSKLAECLRQNSFDFNSNSDEIERILRSKSIKLTNREYRRRMSNQDFVFHRLILDGHIQFPVGISKDAKQAKKLAFRQLIDVCRSATGVQMKPIVGNRVKVVKRSKNNEDKDRNSNHFDGNATYLTSNDFSTLSTYE